MATTQEYANLSEHAYDRTIPLGEYPLGKESAISIGGEDYRILYNDSNPKTGYQGMIYQKYPDGEIIVAHRGTESPSLDPLDAIADGKMVVNRTNPQAQDAIKLVARAQGYAAEQHRFNPNINPAVSITGHSLGGALAEISAFKSGLYGEAFNGYGAASLGYGIEHGKGNFTNHVMAGDPVSAGSPHYGKVITYASHQDIDVLKQHERNAGLPGSTLLAVSQLVGEDHTIFNFIGGGRPNVLDDPQAITRAQQNADIIGHYRKAVSDDRWLLNTLNKNPGNIVEAINERINDLEEKAQNRIEEERNHKKSDYITPIKNIQNSFQQGSTNLNWDSLGALGGLRSDASEYLTNPTLAKLDGNGAMSPEMVAIMKNMPESTKAVDSPFPVTASLSPNISGIDMTRSDASNHSRSVEPTPASPVATIAQAEPIKLPHNIASLHEQITNKFGDQLAHLSEKDQQTAIALATHEATRNLARSVDYVHVNTKGDVLMSFDGDKGFSGEMNLKHVQNNDASQVLTASVDLQQNKQQDLAMRQEHSRSQSGPSMTMSV